MKIHPMRFPPRPKKSLLGGCSNIKKEKKKNAKKKKKKASIIAPRFANASRISSPEFLIKCTQVLYMH